ncbi:MAG: hypothetical protein KF774_01630 [Planctomyces sp.]|nr:hypothetical protein [Planctomyces sp.]
MSNSFTRLALAIVAACGLSGVAAAAEPDAAPPAATRGLLIVAPDAFHSALGSYVEHKRRQLPTTLVSLDTILAETDGVDDPERLKRRLFDFWQREAIGYVLLVGDADVLPVRYMVLDRITPAAFNYSFYPSDLYYSDLAREDGTFDDWNGRKDDFHAGYFGEVRGEAIKSDPINFDGIDYRPDVAVGRWPVSTPDEAGTIVAKTIRYEEGVLSGERAGLRTAALFSVGGWVDSRPTLNEVSNRLGGAWTTEKRFYQDRRSRSDAPLPTQTELVSLLNGGVSLAVHAGHGHDDQWEQCFPLAALAEIRNADRLPVIISAGCSTARFATLPPYEPYVDVHGVEHRGTNFGEIFEAPPPPPAPYQKGRYNPTGLGEQLLRRGPDGAVAYIGCNTGSQPCGLALLRGFAATYESLNAPRLGDCWSGAVAFYYDDQKLAELTPDEGWYPPSIFFQAMKFMCFGDPSLVLPPRGDREDGPAGGPTEGPGDRPAD